jgi:outer membrane receptor protein involved in Fe transport
MWVMQESLSLAEKTKHGADLGLRYQLNDYLYFDADANYTYARSIDEPDGQYIPLAPDFTSTGGLSFQKWYGLSGLRYRYLKVVLQMKIIL